MNKTTRQIEKLKQYEQILEFQVQELQEKRESLLQEIEKLKERISDQKSS